MNVSKLVCLVPEVLMSSGDTRIDAQIQFYQDYIVSPNVVDTELVCWRRKWSEVADKSSLPTSASANLRECDPIFFPILACVLSGILLRGIPFWWRAEAPPEVSGKAARGQFQIDLYALFWRLRRQNSTPTLIPPATQAIPNINVLLCFLWVWQWWTFISIMVERSTSMRSLTSLPLSIHATSY